jgi:GAF domain-containing protein
MTDQPGASREAREAFADLAGVTLLGHSLDTVMEKIAALSKRAVPGTEEASVTLVEGGRPTTVAFTGQLAMDLDERQYVHGHGPCLESIARAEPVRIDSMSAEQRWPDWTAEAVARGARSSLSVPIPVQREVTAALNMYSVDERAFDDAAAGLASTFAMYAGVAIANMHLYQAQVEMAGRTRTDMASAAVLEQAKGIVMAQRRCSAEQALELLVSQARTSKRELRDVAQALVDRTPDPG